MTPGCIRTRFGYSHCHGWQATVPSLILISHLQASRPVKIWHAESLLAASLPKDAEVRVGLQAANRRRTRQRSGGNDARLKTAGDLSGMTPTTYVTLNVPVNWIAGPVPFRAITE